jgi:hypothetical protein
MAPGPSVFQLRITLAQHRSEIWRRVIVPSAIRLDRLHLVMQKAMGWRDAHLHQFRIGEVAYGAVLDDDDESELETDYSLSDLVSPGDRFFYDYDFGDDWVHEIVVEEKMKLVRVQTSRCSWTAPMPVHQRAQAESSATRHCSKHFEILATTSTRNPGACSAQALIRLASM